MRTWKIFEHLRFLDEKKDLKDLVCAGCYKSLIVKMTSKTEKTLESEWRSWKLKIVKFRDQRVWGR